MIRVECTWGYQDAIDTDRSGWHIFQANSAGGVSVKGIVTNYGEKAVKKYSVYFVACNGADEIVECEASGKKVVEVSSADCILPSSTQKLFFENVWYNRSIRRVEVFHIDVVYTDGTTESCDGNYVPTQEEQQAERENSKRILSKVFSKIILPFIIILLLVCILSAIFLIKFFQM